MATFDPNDPLAEEEQNLPSQDLANQYQEINDPLYLKHIADKIRTEIPATKDATDDEALTVFHQLAIPKANHNELQSIVKEMYGQDFKAQEPPLVSFTKPSTAGAMIGDFATNLGRDLTALHQGVYEASKGYVKSGTIGNLEETSQGDYRLVMPENPDPEVKELFAKSNAHLARAGAFAAALLTTKGLSAGMEALPLLRSGTRFIPNLLRAPIKGAADMAGFLGVYDAAREGAKPQATPHDVWNAFQEGILNGAPTGALLGPGFVIGGALVKGVAKSIEKGLEAGKLTREAKTIGEAKIAANKTADAFEAGVQPLDVDPETYAHDLVTKLHGEDVAESVAGKRAIKKIASKIKKQQEIVENDIWTSGVKDEDLLKSLEDQSDNTHDALRVSYGESPKPEPEVKSEPPEKFAKVYQDLKSGAQQDIRDIKNMSADQLLDRFKKDYPDVEPTFKDSEELRDYLLRENLAVYQGSESLLQQELPRARVEGATNAEIVKALVNPRIAHELGQLVKNGATDEELLNFVQRSLGHKYGSTSELAIGKSGKVHAGFDPSLIRKLAQNMYRENLGRIVPKELIQNALDSVKGNPDGRVEVEAQTGYRENERWISINDNGTGMLPETVQRELVDLGASLKPENSAGGFGLAKAALFSNARKLELVTVAAGKFGSKIETTLKGSGEDWINPQKGLSMSQRNVSKETPTGTKLRIDFPLNDQEGAPVDWSNYDIDRYAQNFFRLSRHNIPVSFKLNGEDINVTKPDLQLFKTLNLESANVDIYTGGKDERTSFLNANILNQGIPQFITGIPLGGEAVVPSIVVVDIKSKVSPESAHYPFTTNRENLARNITSTLNEEIRKIAEEAIKRQSNIYKEILTNSPKIKGSHLNTPRKEYSIIDPFQIFSPESVEKIRSNPSYGYLSDLISDLHDSLASELSKIDSVYNKSVFHGLSLDMELLGVNINGKNTIGGEDNFISFNPWTILDEVVRQQNKLADHNLTGNRRKRVEQENMIKNFTGQLIAVMIHEITHQGFRGHDVPFAGGQTRNTGYLVPHIAFWSEELYNSLKKDADKLFIHLVEDGYDLFKEFNDKKGTKANIFTKVSDHVTRAGEYPRDTGSLTFGTERGNKSQKAVPTRSGNTASNVSGSPIGERNFSNIVDWVRNKFKVPNRNIKDLSADEAKMDQLDYLPSQRMNLEALEEL